MKQLYVIEYECAHWCGAAEYVVAWGTSSEDAVDFASDHMQEVMYELYSDEYAEEPVDDEAYFTVVSVELLVGSDHEKFANDPSQESYYPVVGTN